MLQSLLHCRPEPAAVALAVTAVSPCPPVEVAMPRRHDRRTYVDRPFLDDHLASERDRRAEPRGFGGYLRWFLEGFWAETHERVHVAGVWFGRPPRVDGQGRPVEVTPASSSAGRSSARRVRPSRSAS
jgi:hypothetical protein